MAKKELAIVTGVRKDRKDNIILTLSPEAKKPTAKYLRLYNGEVITKQDFLENKGEKPFREIVLDIFVKANLITELDSQCEPIEIIEDQNGKEEKDQKEKNGQEESTGPAKSNAEDNAASNGGAESNGV